MCDIPNDADENLSYLDEEIDETKFCLDEKTTMYLHTQKKFIRWKDYVQRRKLVLIFIFVLSWFVLFNLIPTPGGKTPYVQSAYSRRRTYFTAFTLSFATDNPNDKINLRIMSFNTWGSGANDNKTVTETVEVIRTINPDIIALLEVRAESVPCTSICPPTGPSRAPAIARELGYYIHENQEVNALQWANAILSKYPILRSTENDFGVVLDIYGNHVAMFGIHLTDFPYQPYQLSGIPCDGAQSLKSAKDAIAAATTARGPGMNLLLQEISGLSDAVSTIIVAGDFNEPSHLDWTESAASIRRHPLAVKYPTTLRLETLGFTDTYRTIYPDEISKPGFTWTPFGSSDEKSEHFDRIDYIFVRNATVVSAEVIGEKSPEADIVINPWPSDHRAVTATVSIP